MQKILGIIRERGLRKSFYQALRKLLLLPLSISYFFTRLLRGSAIKEVNGFKMWLDLKNDCGVSRILFLFKKREYLATNFLENQKVLKEGDVWLGIGANIGYYALLGSRLVGDSGKVYALEPVSTNYQALQKNIELNNLYNVRTFKLAAGEKSGFENIHVARRGNWSSMIYRDGVGYFKEEKVRVITVDDFVREEQIEPDFIRMDVEGYECAVIKGAKETLKKLKPKILMEIHPGILGNDLLDAMFSLLDQNHYEKTTVFRELSPPWLSRTDVVNPLLLALAKKIDNPKDILNGVNMETRDLFKRIRKTKETVHALLYSLLALSFIEVLIEIPIW